jgi:hypothetical protein
MLQTFDILPYYHVANISSRIYVFNIKVRILIYLQIFIQDVHMKYIPFYCNIVPELKGAWMKT